MKNYRCRAPSSSSRYNLKGKKCVQCSVLTTATQVHFENVLVRQWNLKYQTTSWEWHYSWKYDQMTVIDLRTAHFDSTTGVAPLRIYQYIQQRRRRTRSEQLCWVYDAAEPNVVCSVSSSLHRPQNCVIPEHTQKCINLKWTHRSQTHTELRNARPDPDQISFSESWGSASAQSRNVWTPIWPGGAGSVNVDAP